MPKRQWSREFSPRAGYGGKTITLSNVPPTLRQRFAAKCRREGKSQRNLLLGWISNWVADRRPDTDAAPHAASAYDSDTAEVANVR